MPDYQVTLSWSTVVPGETEEEAIQVAEYEFYLESIRDPEVDVVMMQKRK